ncbi:MAG: hypothetical protein AB8H03_24395 [Saprospiraceae bacterium]
MNFTKNKKNTSKLESLKRYEITKEEQNKIEGGFLFRMAFQVIDDTRCNIERFGSWATGGNGDGDW